MGTITLTCLSIQSHRRPWITETTRTRVSISDLETKHGRNRENVRDHIFEPLPDDFFRDKLASFSPSLPLFAPFPRLREISRSFPRMRALSISSQNLARSPSAVEKRPRNGNSCEKLSGRKWHFFPTVHRPKVKAVKGDQKITDNDRQIGGKSSGTLQFWSKKTI